MTTGKVIGIYIAPHQGDPTVWMEKVHVIPGSGIEGDRYFQKLGVKRASSRSGRELTLVENEAIDSMRQEGIQISPDQTRRNIITCCISLNELVGRDFYIGKIHLHGVRLCEPCDYLAGRTDPKIKQSMVHRGGLRANILSEGFIHIDDPISTSPKEQA